MASGFVLRAERIAAALVGMGVGGALLFAVLVGLGAGQLVAAAIASAFALAAFLGRPPPCGARRRFASTSAAGHPLVGHRARCNRRHSAAGDIHGRRNARGPISPSVR